MTFASIGKKFWRIAPAATAIVLATIATGCSAGCSASISIGSHKTGGTYSDHGVSFKIPNGWRRMSEKTVQTKTGSELWSESFGAVSGYDLVGVTAYATKVVITQKNSERNAPRAAAAVENLFASAGGSVVSGPTVVTMRGMAGYRFETTFPDQSGAMLESQLLLVWNGHTEYFFNCQYRTNGSRSAEIKRGCKTIESTFKLD